MRASASPNAPHAALLIDFDNVTMGIRSDLTKELKNLLNSDIIKGKVAVQRAYADWRRYPQYIVPLAENSVDLIFAPAYGSSKKNATDIRLAIDALELVFTRPEIGTFILLSGDSDFSSLVLKLKEYGKYVIGVGIRESSSDLLVQNCDEYYSYSGLTGLTRAGDEVSGEAHDPWELVEIAVRQMVEQKDVMRSDRLKQVMLEMDNNFDEKALGFPKFNRFVQEAANRGLLHLRKMENGQFEVGLREEAPLASGVAAPVETAPAVAPEPRSRRGRGRDRDRDRGRDREQERVAPAAVAAAEAAVAEPVPAVAVEAVVEAEAPAPEAPAAPAAAAAAPAEAPAVTDLRGGYDLLRRALQDVGRGRGGPVRDSDLKRRMLELQPGFDEGAFGFSKFSRFLRQAHDAEVIDLHKAENGTYEVTPPSTGGREPVLHAAPARPSREEGPETREGRRERDRRRRDRDRSTREQPAAAAPAAARAEPVSLPAAEGAPVAAARAEAPRPEAQPAAAAREARPAAPAREARPAAPAQEPRPAPAEREARPAAAAPETRPAPAAAAPAVSLGMRRGSRRGSPVAAPPPLLEGQTIPVGRVAALTAEPATLRAEGARPEPATPEAATPAPKEAAAPRPKKPATAKVTEPEAAEAAAAKPAAKRGRTTAARKQPAKKAAAKTTRAAKTAAPTGEAAKPAAKKTAKRATKKAAAEPVSAAQPAKKTARKTAAKKTAARKKTVRAGK